MDDLLMQLDILINAMRQAGLKNESTALEEARRIIFEITSRCLIKGEI